MRFFFAFLSFLILQRFIELVIANRHSKVLFAKGAKEVDRGGYKFVVMMHTAFFISLTLEFILLHRTLSQFWVYLLVLFLLAQLLRYWAITSLGVYWNTRIIIPSKNEIISSGPYRFVKHPNYLAVATELAVIPLLFSCYYTFIVFSVLNSILLYRRIGIESKALAQYSIETDIQ